MEQTEDILVSKSLQCMHCCELATVVFLIYSLLQTLIAAKNAKMIFIWIILVKQFKDIQQLIKNIV